MKYLHSGYILFAEKAEHAEDGRINAYGLFDLLNGKYLPIRIQCHCIVGFGTPYERRQYKGIFTLEDAEGNLLVTHEFQANDPNDLFKGHQSFPIDFTVTKEGSYTARVVLSNWKNEDVWEVQRHFWAMVIGDTPPDP
jgi:hypothetical protein